MFFFLHPTSSFKKFVALFNLLDKSTFSIYLQHSALSGFFFFYHFLDKNIIFKWYLQLCGLIRLSTNIFNEINFEDAKFDDDFEGKIQ